MRIIGDSVVNALKIQDMSNEGGEITLYYRFPTPEERIAYEAMQYERDRDKIKLNFRQARQTFGLKILIGIKKGDLGYKPDGEKIKPLCSDQGDPDYNPEWRKIVEKNAIDLVEALATYAFGVPDTRSTQEVDLGYTEKN